MKTAEENIEFKAEIFKIIRANSDRLTPKQIMKEIRNSLPDVSDEIIHSCLTELCEKAL